MDLDKGFYQLSIKEEDRFKTAFTLPMGHYEYCKTPLGLVNSLKYFQYVINDILGDLENVKIFVDDILIYNSTDKEHYKTVKTVLTRLKEKGAKLNYTKSIFGVEEITFLGMKINSQGIEAETSNVKKHIEITPPRTVKQLQKLIGIINWYRKFIPNLSTKIASLTDKLKK